MTKKISKESKRHLHVCSLSLSALNEVKSELQEHETTMDSLSPEERIHAKDLELKVNALRWIELAMEINRHEQLLNIHKSNSDKSTNPEFRKIKIRPYLNYWRVQNLRSKWLELNKAISVIAAQQRIEFKAKQFQQQRAEKTKRSIIDNLVSFDDLTKELSYDEHAIDPLQSFVTPSSTNPSTQNKDFNYCLSDDIEEWSDTGDLNEDELAELKGCDDNNKIDDSIRAEFAKRAFNVGMDAPTYGEDAKSYSEDDVPIDDEPEEVIAEEKKARRENNQEAESAAKEGKKGVNKVVLIIIGVLLVAALIAFVIIKHKLALSNNTADETEPLCPEPEADEI